MIEYSVLIDKDIFFSCSGHAEGDERDKDGNSLICAIVSAIAQTCAAGCDEYADRYSERAFTAGHLEFICSRNAQTEAITKSAVIGLNEAARRYPEQVKRGDVDVS